MDQWDKEAVQGRILADEQPSCAGRSFAFQHPGAGSYRWRRRIATGRGRGELDFWVIADAPQLPRRVPGTEVGMIPLHRDVDCGADRRTVALVRDQQDRPLPYEGFEGLRRIIHRPVTSLPVVISERKKASQRIFP